MITRRLTRGISGAVGLGQEASAHKEANKAAAADEMATAVAFGGDGCNTDLDEARE